jgi:hypothetical protein
MTSRFLFRSGAAIAATISLIVFTPVALATKLKLRTTGLGLLPAGTTLYLHSTNAKAGEESCTSVNLTGELLSNDKATDKAHILAGTTTGCSAINVGSVTTVLGGFPWTVKMKATGAFSFKGKPRLQWEDTFVPPPGVCKYQGANAVNPGTFSVSGTPQPLSLAIVPPWPIVPVGSSNLCGAGQLEGTFGVEAEEPIAVVNEVVEVEN